MRVVHTKEETNEQALVLTYPYYEESQVERLQDTYTSIPTIASSSQEMETSYQMDHNTLMFIAQGGMGKPVPNQGPKLFKPAAPGPCYGCGGDHWFRDCPNKKDRVPSIPQVRRFCVDCGIKHLIQDCPSNPKFKGKTSLNLVELTPSPCQSSSDVIQEYLLT